MKQQQNDSISSSQKDSKQLKDYNEYLWKVQVQRLFGQRHVK